MTLGSWGPRVLYLHPDVSPPYFWEHVPDPATPLPPLLPHKTHPVITRKFIDERIRQNDLTDTISEHLARCWVPASHAARWLQSKAIPAPACIAFAAGEQTGDNVGPKSPNRRSASSPVDKYGDRPTNGSEDFERLDPGDDRDMLREARRLIVVTPNTDAIAGTAAECDAEPTVGPIVVPIGRAKKPVRSSHASGPRKRFKTGKEPVKSDAAIAAMHAHVLDSKCTLQELENMQPKYLVKHFGDHIGRTSLSGLRDKVVSELKARQMATNDK